MLPFAVIVHLAFATWMFSAVGVFWDGRSFEQSTVVTYFGFSNISSTEDGFNFDQRLAMQHILPLYITLFAIVALGLLGFFFKTCDKVRIMCCATVTCGIFDDGTIKRRYLNPDYTDAVEQGEVGRFFIFLLGLCTSPITINSLIFTQNFLPSPSRTAATLNM
jgi:hypothetical protein